jgi:hypothetical protein
MPDPVQTDLWKEEVTDPSPELAAALEARALRKQAIKDLADVDKVAKDRIRALAKSMEPPGDSGQLIIHANGTRWACDLKNHTRVSIKELPEED